MHLVALLCLPVQEGFYLDYHNQVQLRFKLAAGLGEPWCRDGGTPGCPLSTLLIVALHVSWRRRLESMLPSSLSFMLPT